MRLFSKYGSICLLGAALLGFGGVQATANTAETTPLFFKLEQDGVNYEMARVGLKTLLEESEDKVGRKIPIGVARHDLNSDGVNELFVRLLDQELFCVQEDCDTYAFAVIENDLSQIAHFKARTIDVLNSQTDNAKDLQATLQNGQATLLRWDGKRYSETEAKHD